MATPCSDMDLLGELAVTMADASICGLGQAAPNPLLSAIKYFPQDVNQVNIFQGDTRQAESVAAKGKPASKRVLDYE